MCGCTGAVPVLVNSWRGLSVPVSCWEEIYAVSVGIIAGSPPISLSLIVGKSKCDGKASVTRRFFFYFF